MGSSGDHAHSGRDKRALATVREMVRDMEQVTESEEERRVTILAGEEEAILSGLEYYSVFALSISAFNSKGEGPRSSPKHFRTSEGGKKADSL